MSGYSRFGYTSRIQNELRTVKRDVAIVAQTAGTGAALEAVSLPLFLPDDHDLKIVHTSSEPKKLYSGHDTEFHQLVTVVDEAGVPPAHSVEVASTIHHDKTDDIHYLAGNSNWNMLTKQGTGAPTFAANSHRGATFFDQTATQIKVGGNAAWEKVITENSGTVSIDDSVDLKLGNDAYVTAVAPDFTIDNRNTGGKTIFQLGSDDANTELDVKNNTGTNLVQVKGDGNMIINANLTVNGTTTTLSTSTISIEDSAIKLASENVSDTIDVGLYGKYNDGTD